MFLLEGLKRSLNEHPADADSDVPAPIVPSPPADIVRKLDSSPKFLLLLCFTVNADHYQLYDLFQILLLYSGLAETTSEVQLYRFLYGNIEIVVIALTGTCLSDSVQYLCSYSRSASTKLLSFGMLLLRCTPRYVPVVVATLTESRICALIQGNVDGTKTIGEGIWP